jgi:hypothetical protein
MNIPAKKISGVGDKGRQNARNFAVQIAFGWHNLAA